MDIQEYLHAHLSSANCLLTKMQSEMPRNSKEWQQLVAAIAYVRAAQAIAQFLPPMPAPTGLPTNDPAHFEGKK